MLAVHLKASQGLPLYYPPLPQETSVMAHELAMQQQSVSLEQRWATKASGQSRCNAAFSTSCTVS